MGETLPHNYNDDDAFESLIFLERYWYYNIIIMRVIELRGLEHTEIVEI